MKIIHISDLHIGETKDNPKILDKLIEEVNDQNAEAIFITGDLTDEGLAKEYDGVLSIIKRFKKMPYVVPGNHDARNDGLELFKEHFHAPPFAEYIKTLDATAIGLNSTLPDTNEGMIGEQQMGWLKKILPGARGEKILYMHHHVLPVPHTGRERNILYDAGDILQIAKDYKVNLILSGHKHQHHVWLLGDTVIANAGTAYANKLILHNRHSYNIITVSENKITVELKEVGFPTKPLLYFDSQEFQKCITKNHTFRKK